MDGRPTYDEYVAWAHEALGVDWSDDRYRRFTT